MEEHNGDEEEDLGGEEEVVCFSSFSLFLSSSLSFPFSFPFFFYLFLLLSLPCNICLQRDGLEGHETRCALDVDVWHTHSRSRLVYRFQTCYFLVVILSFLQKKLH